MSLRQCDEDTWVNVDQVLYLTRSSTSFAKTDIYLKDGEKVYSQWPPLKVQRTLDLTG